MSWCVVVTLFAKQIVHWNQVTFMVLNFIRVGVCRKYSSISQIITQDFHFISEMFNKLSTSATWNFQCILLFLIFCNFNIILIYKHVSKISNLIYSIKFIQCRTFHHFWMIFIYQLKWNIISEDSNRSLRSKNY